MCTKSTFKEFIDSLKAIETHINELQAEADAIIAEATKLAGELTA